MSIYPFVVEWDESGQKSEVKWIHKKWAQMWLTKVSSRVYLEVYTFHKNDFSWCEFDRFSTTTTSLSRFINDVKEFLLLRIIINPSKKPQPQHFPRNYLWIIMTKEQDQKCVTTIRRPVAFNHKFKHFNIIYIEHVICIQRTVHVNCCHKCLDKCTFFVPFSFEQTTNAKN